MAVLRVEIELDGDVYPELHAALLSIAGDASRAERLRQLAASGLVWEKIRVHGPAVVHGAPPEVRMPVAAAPTATRAPAPIPAARKAAPAPPKSRARVAEPLPAPPSADFVDLALDAVPPPPPPLQAPRAPPVLMDIVDPEDVRSAPLVPVRRPASLAEAPALPAALAAAPPVVLPVPAVVPPPAPALPDELEAVAEAPPEPPLEHRSSTRSRLQRMKERGLFKNG